MKITLTGFANFRFDDFFLLMIVRCCFQFKLLQCWSRITWFRRAFMTLESQLSQSICGWRHFRWCCLCFGSGFLAGQHRYESASSTDCWCRCRCRCTWSLRLSLCLIFCSKKLTFSLKANCFRKSFEFDGNMFSEQHSRFRWVFINSFNSKCIQISDEKITVTTRMCDKCRFSPIK